MNRAPLRPLRCLAFALVVLALAAPASGARSTHVTARFISFTWYRNGTCNVEFGVLFANVRGAVSYSFSFTQKGYGPQKLTDIVPNATADQLLVSGRVPHASGSHFSELGAGGSPQPRSRCHGVTSPYAAEYSKLRVDAQLK